MVPDDSGVMSVAIQLLLTSFVLRRFGVGIALLALPLGLLVASVGVFLIPVLLTATLAKGAEGALRYSLDQSTRELLFSETYPRMTLLVKSSTSWPRSNSSVLPSLRLSSRKCSMR